MKKLIYGILTLTLLTLTNCSSVKNDISSPNSIVEVKRESFKLVAENSSLEWKGNWIGGKSDGKTHNGIVAITSGTVTQNGEDFSGYFIVDMNDIKCTDIKDEGKGAKLVEDLESDYFFKVAQFPNVDINIQSISNDSSSVTVKVLGIPITQTLPIKASTTGNTMTLTGSFYFDLAKANIKELFANPLESDMGGLSSKVLFNLNVELAKK